MLEVCMLRAVRLICNVSRQVHGKHINRVRFKSDSLEITMSRNFSKFKYNVAKRKKATLFVVYKKQKKKPRKLWAVEYLSATGVRKKTQP